MATENKTSSDLKHFVKNWHCGGLRITAISAVEHALELSQNMLLKWKYSDPEKQWTADPNFVAFRFPTTKNHFKCWIYTRNEIDEIDGLEFDGARPKVNPTYQSVTVTKPAHLAALKKYIKHAFHLKNR